MLGRHSRRSQRAGGIAWTRNELIAHQGVYDYLAQLKFTGEGALAAGVSAVLSAPDRDGFLAAIEQCPELLTDKGNQLFEILVMFAQMLGQPRVTERVRRGQEAVQAVREARA